MSSGNQTSVTGPVGRNKALWHDADHGAIDAVECDASADDARVAGESGSARRPAHDHGVALRRPWKGLPIARLRTKGLKVQMR